MAFWIAVLIAPTYSILEVLRQRQIPDAAFWTTGPGHEYRLVLAAAGVISVIYVTVESLMQRRRLADNDRVRAVEELTQSLLLNFHEASKIPITALIAHVWKENRGLVRDGTLKRIAIKKLDSRIPVSGVTWTRKKGALGRAWEVRDSFTLDLEPVHVLFDAGRNAFNTADPDDRLHLTYDEFRKVRHYRSVYVAPLFNQDNGEVIGAVTVGCTETGLSERLKTAGEKPAVDEPLTAIERLVRQL